MTTLEKLNLSQPLTDVYTAMETDLMVAIARQLAAGGEINATSEWRLKKLAETGKLTRETVKIIASYTGIQSDLLTETIESAAAGIVDRLEPALQACAADGFVTYQSGTPISEGTKNVVTNFRKQAKTDLNLVNTVMQYKAGSSYKNLVNKIYDESNRQELLSTLGKHTLATATGAETRQEAVRNCIKEFSQKGIPAFVDAAGREWSPEAYINMDIKTTVSNTAHAAQDAVCDRYGIDLIEISSHMGARPKCALDQGKLFSRSNQSGIAHDGNGNEIPFYPWSSSSYGQPDGILGINCGHNKYPWVEGVNFQTYFPYDQEENAARYKEFQQQRSLERKVRQTSREVDMLKAVGDEEGAKAARKKLAEQRKAYRDYSDSHGLKQRSDRLTVTRVRNGDNVFADIHKGGIVGNSGGVLTNGSGGGKIKSQENDNITNFLNHKKLVDSENQKLEALEKEEENAFFEWQLVEDENSDKYNALEKIYNQKAAELNRQQEYVDKLIQELAPLEQKAVIQIEDDIAGFSGIPRGKISLTGLNYDMASEISNSMRITINKYPELNGQLSRLKYIDNYKPGNSDVYAGCKAISGEITLYKPMKNAETIRQQYIEDVNQKFHPEGTDSTAIVPHEMGHALDGYMTKNNILGGYIGTSGTRRTSDAVNKIVLNELGWFDRVDDIRRELTAQGIKGKELYAEIDKARDEFITNEIGGYACGDFYKPDSHEMFAELFAEYVMSSQPRKAAMIFGKLIDEALGR